MNLAEDSAPLDRQRLVNLVVFEYRSLVVRRLAVTAEWRVLEWTDSAACSDSLVTSRDLCLQCPVAAECLAAAIASDDPAEWRGGVSRADREHLWSGLERTYREVRDFELMKLDIGRVARPRGRHSPGDLGPESALRVAASTNGAGRSDGAGPSQSWLDPSAPGEAPSAGTEAGGS